MRDGKGLAAGSGRPDALVDGAAFGRERRLSCAHLRTDADDFPQLRVVEKVAVLTLGYIGKCSQIADLHRPALDLKARRHTKAVGPSLVGPHVIVCIKVRPGLPIIFAITLAKVRIVECAGLGADPGIREHA